MKNFLCALFLFISFGGDAFSKFNCVDLSGRYLNKDNNNHELLIIQTNCSVINIYDPSLSTIQHITDGFSRSTKRTQHDLLLESSHISSEGLNVIYNWIYEYDTNDQSQGPALHLSTKMEYKLINNNNTLYRKLSRLQNLDLDHQYFIRKNVVSKEKCQSDGFDCSEHGKCINHGTIKNDANKHPDYEIAIEEVKKTPSRIFSWKHIFNFCK
ncbi:MAG: hypothetical protein HN576_01810 [Bacteriovoracaceae bacterium]|nr:hypothetical protein [Bacteriovoracaceae bacterium]